MSDYVDHTILRDKYKTHISRDVLIQATKDKIDFHTDRMKVWQDKEKSIRENLKNGGINISDVYDPSLGYSNAHTGPSIKIDPALEKQLIGAYKKIQEHERKVQEYSSWLGFFSYPQGELFLTINDYLYFFGK